jgi:hypothetical protein
MARGPKTIRWSLFLPPAPFLLPQYTFIESRCCPSPSRYSQRVPYALCLLRNHMHYGVVLFMLLTALQCQRRCATSLTARLVWA